MDTKQLLIGDLDSVIAQLEEYVREYPEDITAKKIVQAAWDFQCKITQLGA